MSMEFNNLAGAGVMPSGGDPLNDYSLFDPDDTVADPLFDGYAENRETACDVATVPMPILSSFNELLGR